MVRPQSEILVNGHNPLIMVVMQHGPGCQSTVAMKHITVTRTNTRYSALHPCSKHPIFLDGTTWPTVIHYFLGKQLSDGLLVYRILMTKTPNEAYAIAKSASDSVRVEVPAEQAHCVIQRAYHGKILQHANVRGALLRTSDARITIDLSGCGQWALAAPFAGGQLLAKSLTNIRQELTKNGPFDELATTMLPPWVKFPNVQPDGYRFGAGDGYNHEFYAWHRGLTVEGRRKFNEMYPPPKGWR